MSLLVSSNQDYHSNRTHLSSSNLKLLLKDPARFHQEWVLGQKPVEEENPNFTEGHFVHSLVLEPETISKYAVFPGMRKQGAVWEEFKAQNAGKVILSAPQVNRCEALHTAYASLPIAVQLCSGGLAEHTMLANIQGIAIKSRADYINIQDGYIVDVKTTAMPSDIELFRATIAQYSYELSAALYCEAAQQTYQKPFDFYWLVLSKADQKCEVYKASAATLATGVSMYSCALHIYKKCLTTGIWSLDTKADKSTKEYEVLEV